MWRLMGQLNTAHEARKQGRRDDIELSYYTVRPNKWTFHSRKIREWVEQRLEGRVLNACAGKTKLSHDRRIIRNDTDPDVDADIHLDVCELADHLEHEQFGTIIFDPPFSEYQASRSYEGRTVGNVALAKRQFHQLLKPGGKVIQFGFTTTCMPVELEEDDGSTTRYYREEAVIWNTLGQMNDYLSVVDRKEGELDAPPVWFSNGEDDGKEASR